MKVLNLVHIHLAMHADIHVCKWLYNKHVMHSFLSLIFCMLSLLATRVTNQTEIPFHIECIMHTHVDAKIKVYYIIVCIL